MPPCPSTSSITNRSRRTVPTPTTGPAVSTLPRPGQLDSGGPLRNPLSVADVPGATLPPGRLGARSIVPSAAGRGGMSAARSCRESSPDSRPLLVNWSIRTSCVSPLAGLVTRRPASAAAISVSDDRPATRSSSKLWDSDTLSYQPFAHPCPQATASTDSRQADPGRPCQEAASCRVPRDQRDGQGPDASGSALGPGGCPPIAVCEYTKTAGAQAHVGVRSVVSRKRLSPGRPHKKNRLRTTQLAVSAADVNCTDLADENCTPQAGDSVTCAGAGDVCKESTSAVTSLPGAGPE